MREARAASRAPLELVVNDDNGEPYDESIYRHWVSIARAIAVFGFVARDTVRQAIVRADRLAAELIRTVDGLFALSRSMRRTRRGTLARSISACVCWRNGWMRRSYR